MNFLDLTFKTPSENLACDEALLDFYEENGGEGVLRFWEPEDSFVVVGYANQMEREVNVAACEAEGVPILRRCSGGGTVLQGPGCLNYSLVLKIEEGGPLAGITSANRSIMERNREAIEGECRRKNEECRIEVRGHTDLAIGNRQSATANSVKFSGNAQRRKKHFLLFHGTFLLNFDLAMIDRLLRMPSKEPDYREGRSHKNFVTNLEMPADDVKRALRAAWNATEDLAEGSWRSRVESLARDRYVTKEWNFKF